MRVMFLGNYAPNAVKGLIAGSDREAAGRTLIESVGGKFVSLQFTRGTYDVVLTADVPDQASSMGLAMAIRASGSFTDISVLEHLDMTPVIAAAQKATKSYKAPG